MIREFAHLGLLHRAAQECKTIYTIGVFQDISKRIRELAWIEKDVVASTEAQERCTMQFVQIVASRPRFPSSPMGPGQCIAASATRSTGLQEHREGTEPF